MHDILNNVFPELLDGQAFLRIFIRLTAAILLGGAVGFERQMEGKSRRRPYAHDGGAGGGPFRLGVVGEQPRPQRFYAESFKEWRRASAS